MNKHIAVFSLVALAGVASAQLVIGSTTQVAGQSRAFYYDLTTHATTQMWAVTSGVNNKVNGLAADDTTGRIYFNDAARLGFWNYGTTNGATTTMVAGMYRTNGTTTSATGLDDLTSVNGVLYGWTQFASSTFQRGIYQVPVTSDGASPTPHLLLNALWTDPTATYGFQGLAYNSSNGLFYGMNTNATTHAVGLYSIDAFGGGAVNFVAGMPAGRTGVDGLTFNGTGSTAYMSEMDPVGQDIAVYSFDLATATYGPTVTFGLPDTTARASDIVWAPNALTAVTPEPASMAVLGLGALALIRKKRSK